VQDITLNVTGRADKTLLIPSSSTGVEKRKKEMKEYEEISGVVSGVNVSCDVLVERLQSITGVA
jgi:hypothetical protein